MATDKKSDTSNIGEGFETQSCKEQMPTDNDAAGRWLLLERCASAPARGAQVTNPSLPPLLPTSRESAAAPSYSLLLCCSRNTNKSRRRLGSLEASDVLSSLSNAQRHLEKSSCFGGLSCPVPSWHRAWRPSHPQNGAGQDGAGQCYFSAACSRGIEGRRGAASTRRQVCFPLYGSQKSR